MRLNYRILWFDDSPSFIGSLEGDIKEHLKDLGFEGMITPEKDGKRLQGFLDDWDVNLLLLDENLAGGDKGTELLKQIRDRRLYTEAVLYAKNPEDAEGFERFEGVYYAEHGDLLPKTLSIIDLTLRKNQDLGNMRGLVIAEAIDMSRQMEAIIAKILGLQGSKREFFIEEIMHLEFASDEVKRRILQKFLKIRREERENEYRSMNDGLERTKVKEALDAIRTLDDIFSDYRDDVLEVRNSFAHGELDEGRRADLTWHGNTVTYTEQEKIRVRRNFMNHSENLSNIHAWLDQKLS